MISDGIIGIFGGFLSWCLEAIYGLVFGPPTFMVQGFATMGDIWDIAHQFETWIPVTLTATVTAAVGAAYIANLFVQLLRTIASYLTFGGGAT